jgi:hypothetical protein
MPILSIRSSLLLAMIPVVSLMVVVSGSRAAREAHALSPDAGETTAQP